MKKEFKRCVEIIVEANEHIVDNVDTDEDAMWDEFDLLRKDLSYKQNQVLQRLLHSVGYVEPKDIEVDEADPGSGATWAGPS